MPKKAILFINISKMTGYPLGIACLGSAVEKYTDYESLFFDYSYYVKKKFTRKQIAYKLLSILKKYSINYVGMTYFFDSYSDAVFLSSFFKKYNPSCVVLLGGATVSSFGSVILNKIPSVDVLVYGEGEKVLCDILRGKDLSLIPNVSYRKQKEICSTNRDLNYNYSLKELPLPKRSFVNNEYYIKADFIRNGHNTVRLEFSRGCVAHCNYCYRDTHHGYYKVRPPKKIIAEILSILKENPHVTYVYFVDSFLPLRSAAFRNFIFLLKKYKLNKQLTFTFDTRASEITDDVLALLKSINIGYIGIGVESFSQKALDLMNKNITVEQNIKAIIKLKKMEINYMIYLIVNYPGTSFNDFVKTLIHIVSLNVDFVTSNYYIAMPGTKEYFRLVANKQIPDVKDVVWTDTLYQSYYTKNITFLSVDEYLFIDKIIDFYSNKMILLNFFRYFINIHKHSLTNIINFVQAYRYIILKFYKILRFFLNKK